MSTLLPLFPLQLVVFPRTHLPLHIFEERYKEMVGEAIRSESEFGIVLAKGDGIVNAGCTVTVERVVTEYPDGRMDVITQGARRFEILYLDQEKAYLRGEVQYFDDDENETVPDLLQQRAIQMYREVAQCTDLHNYVEPVLSDPQLSFQLAHAAQDADFQSVLLRSRSEIERLEQLADYLERQMPQFREIARLKHVAPMNGFGRKPAGL